MIPFLLANEAAEAAMPVHDMIIVASAAGVVAVLLATAGVARMQLGVVPKGLGAVYEHIFEWIDAIALGFMGPQGRNYVPLAMSFFLFILFSNWMGLLPWPPLVPVMEHGKVVEYIAPFESPSTSYSTTLALAVLGFLAFMLLGLKKRIFPPAPEHAASHDHSHDHAHDHSHDHAHDHAHEEHHGGRGGLDGAWEWISHYWHPVPQLFKSMEGAMKAFPVLLFFFFVALNIVEEVARVSRSPCDFTATSLASTPPRRTSWARCLTSWSRGM